VGLLEDLEDEAHGKRDSFVFGTGKEERGKEMKKLGLVALGFAVILVDGVEQFVKLAAKEGSDFVLAYKAASKAREESQK
jgi:hypothetical protein